MRAWRRFIRTPQKVWLRRAVFQVHLWCGVALGAYIFFISVTGAVLVYSNEMYFAATPDESLSADPAPASSDAGPAPIPLGIRFVSTLIDLHADLLGGSTGRIVNGIGAAAVLVAALTGAVIWWPGIARWRRSLTLHRGVGWKRFFWDLHSTIGFWSFAFILIFALSGLYLCFPEAFNATADRLEPLTAENAGQRFVDGVLYWLAYLHFGRINGIGIPCDGPGVCDQTTKAVWAFFGFAPAAMFVTGAIVWWNRVVKRWWRRRAGGSAGAGSG